jgi:hypothetical protein
MPLTLCIQSFEWSLMLILLFPSILQSSKSIIVKQDETYTFASCRTSKCQHFGFVNKHIQTYDEDISTKGYG